MGMAARASSDWRGFGSAAPCVDPLDHALANLHIAGTTDKQLRTP